MQIPKEDEKRFLDWVEKAMEIACTTDKIELSCFPNSYICHTLKLDYGIVVKNAPQYWDWLKSPQGKKLNRIVNRILKKHNLMMNSGGGVHDKPGAQKGYFE